MTSEQQKSIIFYTEWFKFVNRKIPPEDVAELWHAIGALHITGEDVSENLPLSVYAIFKQMKAQFDRNNQKWETVKEKRREAGKLGGKKSGEKRLEKTKQTKQTKHLLQNSEEPHIDSVSSDKNSVFSEANEANEAVNVNGNVNVNVNVISKDINKEKNIKKENEEPVKKYGEYNNVKLTDSQYQKALAYYGDEERLKKGIEILSEYLPNSKQKYKDHSLVLKGWVKKEVVKRYGWLDVDVDKNLRVSIHYPNCEPITEVQFIEEGLSRLPIETQKACYETWMGYSEPERYCVMVTTFDKPDIENKFQFAVRCISNEERRCQSIGKNKHFYNSDNPRIRL